MKKLFSISEVAQICMTEPHILVYALARGRIKEPVRLNGRRAFSQKDLEKIQQYFQKPRVVR